MGLSNGIHPALNLKKYISDFAIKNSSNIIVSVESDYKNSIEEWKRRIHEKIDNGNRFSAIVNLFKRPKPEGLQIYYKKVSFWRNQLYQDKDIKSQDEIKECEIIDLLSLSYLFFGLYCFYILAVNSFIVWKKLFIAYQIINFFAILFISIVIINHISIVIFSKTIKSLFNLENMIKFTLNLSLSLFVLLIIIIVFVPSGSYIFNVKYDIYIINTSLLIIISFFPILLHCLIILRYYYCTKKLTYFYLENYSLIPSESFSPTEFK